MGAGDGNFALACAREGASVMACDISPGMVERGRARSREEGYDVEWLVGDAEALPFEDARFDCVGSAFGAFIAPRPEVVARELFRVVRPGGTVGLTAWAPEGVMAEMFGIGRRFAPLDPDQQPPERWGEEATARERLEPHAARVEYERRRMVWQGESPAGVHRGVQRLGADDGGRAAGAPARALRGADGPDGRHARAQQPCPATPR